MIIATCSTVINRWKQPDKQAFQEYCKNKVSGGYALVTIAIAADMCNAKRVKRQNIPL